MQPTNLISVESLSKAYAEKPLFNEINFGVSQGQKLAIVGKNGAGKSTLMRIIAGQVPADKGKVTYRKGIRTGYLPQVPKLDDDKSILDNIFNQQNPMANAVRQYEQSLISGDGLEESLQEMERLNAWDFEANAKQVLGKLGLKDTSLRADALSGGQRKRVALARLLLESPDILLLDEPTNHLDIEAIEWLEKFLADNASTLVLITHDRYFLESVTNQILELADLKVYKHEGSYTDFLQNKIERQQVALTERDKARKLMKTELDWLRRQPKARGTKAKSRVEAFDGIQSKAKKNLTESSVDIKVHQVRQGKKIVEFQDVSFGYEKLQVIDHFTYKFAKGEKVGVVGPNGVGKSTFLNLMTGMQKPDSGKVVIGETTKFGYYTQESVDLNDNQRVIEEMREIAEYVKLGDGSRVSVSKFLELFLFDAAQQYTPIANLSGGERRRLQLMKVLLKEPNFLILDEPTNDFDLDTLNVLEDYLIRYSGSLVVVSHDRYFIDKVCDRLFVFEGEGGIKDYPGNYTDYREERASRVQELSNRQSGAGKKNKPQKEKKSDTQKLSYNEQRELEQLEVSIEKLEKRKKEIVEEMNNGSGDHDLLAQLGEELKTLDAQLEKEGDRWLELSDRS